MYVIWHANKHERYLRVSLLNIDLRLGEGSILTDKQTLHNWDIQILCSNFDLMDSTLTLIFEAFHIIKYKFFYAFDIICSIWGNVFIKKKLQMWVQRPFASDWFPIKNDKHYEFWFEVLPKNYQKYWKFFVMSVYTTTINKR